MELGERSFERSLKHALKNWVAKQAPPRESRIRLLAAAQTMQDRSLENLISNGDYKRGRLNTSRDLFSLFYAPQMSNVAAWINF